MAETPESVPFEELINSDLFTFIVGKERKSFVLHSKAVAATSPVFSALIYGGLSEAQTRTAELEDIEPHTFSRFSEYAYRRDYTVPVWTRDEGVALPVRTPPTPPAPHEEPIDGPVPVVELDIVEEFPASRPPTFADTWGAIRKSPKKSKKLAMRSNFTKRRYLVDEVKPRDALISGFEPASNSSSYQNFTSIFLAHAQLYTLADMRLILPLKTLALHKLHNTLSGFTLYVERIADVLELAKYAYSHGEDRSEDGELDELRELVVRFIACEPKAFGKHKEFKHLMDSEGEFAGDLWDVITLELL